MVQAGEDAGQAVPSVRRRSEKTFHSPIWAGTKADLLDLLARVETGFRDQRLAELREIEDKKARDRAEGYSEDLAEEYAARARKRHEENWRSYAVAVVRRSGEEVTGTLADVLAALPGSDISELRVYYPSATYEDRKVSLSFTPGLGLLGKVRGDDQTWMHGMVSALRTEAARRCPRYGLAHKPWPNFALYLGLVGALLLLLTALGSRLRPPEADRVISTLVISLVSTVLASSLMTQWVLQRVLPRFEVLEPGAKPSGNARLASIFMGVVVAGVVGVIVNVLV